MEAILRVDPDVRPSMIGDVVLVGGSSILPGLPVRLKQDLTMAAPAHLREVVQVRVLGGDALQHRYVYMYLCLFVCMLW